PYAGSQPRPIRTELSSGLPPLTRETVSFLRRLTRPLSRLIRPGAAAAGAGGAGGAAGGGGGRWAAGGPLGGGADGRGALGGGVSGLTTVGVWVWGAAGSSTDTPKSVAI